MSNIANNLETTRDMKESGIEWIGMIPKDWGIRKVKDIFKIGRGRVISKLELVNDGIYPVFSSQTLNNGCLGYINTYDFDCKQLTWTTDGANAGEVFYREGKHNCTNVCGTLQLKNKLNSLKFHGYYLRFATQYYKRPDINGAKIMNNEMANILLLIPPLSEQQAIANYLDEQVGKIDELIAEQKTAIENWKSYKQSLITETVTKGLNPNVEMKDSGIEWIGEIPKEWEVKKSKYLINFRTGLSITKKDFVESGYKTINYGQIHSKYTFDLDLTRDDLFKVSFDYAQSNPLAILKKGDFVFCDTSEDLNGCGNCVLVENTNEEVLLAGSHTTIGRLKEKSVPRYMAYLFKSDKVRAQIRANVVGIKVFSITQKILNNTFLIIPPLYEQQQIADYLDEKCLKIDETVEQKQVLIKQLEEYKQSLIYECVTGKRCVL